MGELPQCLVCFTPRRSRLCSSTYTKVIHGQDSILHIGSGGDGDGGGGGGGGYTAVFW